jgi:acetyl-CoA carboxylase biotin carboxyl carrier protein
VKELPTVNAPLTGVFYRSSSPQTEAFVQVGSNVASGDVIGLIEAMKLFNEIRSTASGKVRRIFAENGQLVRAHQPLLEVEPG